MKAWKEDIVDRLAQEAAGCRIVSLRETANAMGINHISAGDCRDILAAAEKRLVGYRPVRMMNTPHDSLFCSLTFIEDDVTFDDGEVL